MRKGFTLIELLIVIAIIALLGAALLATSRMRIQLAKARDGKRKSDFKKMQNILEDYYNDHNQYPQTDQAQCGSSLSPYIAEAPCDPLANQDYLYMSCKNEQAYVFLANLENKNDPAINEGECSAGCEVSILGTYNFGVLSPNMSLTDLSDCEPPSSVCLEPLQTIIPDQCSSFFGRSGFCGEGYILTCNGSGEPRCCPAIGD